MAEAKEEKVASTKSEKKGGSLFVLIFSVVNLVVMGGGAFLVYSSTIGYSAPQASEKAELASLIEARDSKGFEPILYSLDKFNVDLSGSPKRKLRVEMHLEMLGENGFEEVFDLGAKARDSIMMTLNSKVFADIESIQGKLFLKDQIATKLNKMMKGGVVKDIYFSEFLIQ